MPAVCSRPTAAEETQPHLAAQEWLQTPASTVVVHWLKLPLAVRQTSQAPVVKLSCQLFKANAPPMRTVRTRVLVVAWTLPPNAAQGELRKTALTPPAQWWRVQPVV
jgi:hypothetical protein